MAIRVHLADDHTMFREALEALFSSREGIKVVGRSSTGGQDAVALVERNKPDVVIAEIDRDLQMAKEVLSKIRSASPDSKIVVLTMFDNLHYLKALSKMGIDAYLHKTSSSQELFATIDAASREPVGENVVVSMPRGLIERIEEEPMGGLSERDGGVGFGSPRPLQLPDSRRAAHLRGHRQAPPCERLPEDRGPLKERGDEDGPHTAANRANRNYLR